MGDHFVNLSYRRQRTPQKAAKYLKKAADCQKLAKYNYACMRNHEGSGIPINYEEFTKYIKIDLGNSHAMNDNVIMLKTGKGVQQNYKAIIYLKKSIAIGNELAMHIYVNMLVNGKRVEQNFLSALIYFKMAEEKGMLYGMHRIPEDLISLVIEIQPIISENKIK
ncbi:hypothetical protein TRFO_42231 [Tritrichomonas foetus]|uniref:Sel1 repeat family protein n=1 Tax=Tritrichomonas foetus TaxID=1144522 RepID=A0A1J4L1R9_9EUKA|nr:hypothetical protein TRFO_42231 [Tritrichomonas foetus]|eukprot:OHT15894.1 hypothetical protein TRFO_42231 [Tritrichomonas foetus]